MHKNVIFVADFFADEIPGGGELNNEELIKLLISKDCKTKKINSHLISTDFLKDNKDCDFIVSNFVRLNQECIKYLTNHLNYVIYEHDHKYLITRNPATFENYVAPKNLICNYEFYKSAKAVICQSKFHADIVKRNLGFDNIVSVGGNLWSEEVLEKIKEYSLKEKKDKCSIMNSHIEHKNTREAIFYCKHKNLEYDLIDSCSYYEFLDRLSNNDKLVFFPKTPETLSRIVVEARMMGMSVIINKRVGASSEEWFEHKGEDLINVMKNKRNEILNLVESVFSR